jgi:23S rRNA (uracil1939-C5)-methyltransferase
VPYAQQLEEKRARLRRALEVYPELSDVAVPQTRAAAPITGYRTRAKLVVGPGGAIGLYARGGGHVVVDVPDCRVLAPAVSRAVASVRALLRDGTLYAEDDGLPREGALVSVDVREVTGRGLGEAPAAMVVLGVRETRRAPRRSTASRVRAGSAPEPAAALEVAAARLVASGTGIASVAVSVVAGGSPRVLGARLRVLRGPDALPDRAGGGQTWLLAAHGGFVQAHRGTAAAIQHALLTELGEVLGGLGGRRVLDLYAGSGALGLTLAAGGAEVLCVESYRPAVDQLLRAAAAQGLRELRAVTADAADEVGRLVRSRVSVDAVVLNPPRRGLAPEVRTAVAALGPRVVAYVSCDPDTLARDLAHLRRLGYAPTAAGARPHDLIPLTDEVETLVVLRPAPPPPPRILHEDETVIAVDKAPHEPTTPQGEREGSLLARVRALPGLAEAQPVHRLDAGTSGICLFARRAADVAPWQRALGAADAEKSYTALVRGIARAKGSITRPLIDDGVARPARTRYWRVEVVGGHTMIVARPDEGRMHQIRRHLAAIGHPVLGDGRYGHAPSNRHLVERTGLDRPFLHCAALALTHPHTGVRLVLEAPLPPDLALVLARLRGGADGRSVGGAGGGAGGRSTHGAGRPDDAGG